MSSTDEQRTFHLEEHDPPNDARADELAAFLREQSEAVENYPPEKLAYVRWKLTHNDTAPGFATLAVSDQTQRCVGLTTVVPKRLWRHGKEVRWAEIGDSYTDSQFQRRGLFVKVAGASRARAQAAGFEIVYGLPNDQALPGWVGKLGFAVKPDLALFQDALPLSTRPVAARPWFDRHALLGTVLRSSSVARASTGVVRGALRARSLGNDVEVARVASFGAEFDDLWVRARQHIPNAQVRDARHLRWRFDRNPFSFITLAATRNGQLAGYVVLLIRDSGGAHRFKHAIVLDWLYDRALDDGGAVSRALLVGAARFSARAGADLISATSTPVTPIPLPFRSLAFLRRPVDLPIIVHQNDAGLRLLAEREPFHFTLADTDSF